MKLLEQTLTSLEVAEMVGRSHDNVLKDIRTILRHLGLVKNDESSNLGGIKSYPSYFSESKYKNSQNKDLPCYELTKKGCELYGTRMTGEKGTLFAVAYIERFNEMETVIKEEITVLPSSPRDALRLMFDYQEETAERVDVVEQDVKYLKEEVRLDASKYNFLSKRISNKISEALKELCLNPKSQGPLRRDLSNSINTIVGVRTRSQIKEKDFDSILDFIDRWQPSTLTIDLAKQLELELQEA